MRKKIWELLLLAGIIAIYLLVTGYHLRLLPGEWYGDITIEHKEVLSILSGAWPWRFSFSAGPAYHYIVAAFAYFLGPTFETYKIASVATGLVVVVLSYLLGLELAGRRLGLLAALVAALSFWLILFARLGSSPQILSPLLSAAAVYFLLRYARTCRLIDVALSMIFAAVGLYTYPATFVLPGVVLAIALWQLIFTRPRAPWLRALVIAVVVLLPFAYLFYSMVKSNPAFSQQGYVGSKVFEAGSSPLALLETFGRNMLVALGMFQFTGDNAFRTNASGRPMLDPLSGALMGVGLVWLFLEPRLRRNWMFVLLPIPILLAPSAEPGIPAVEIPSASRALGVAPLIFLLVALGLDAILVSIQRAMTAESARAAGQSPTRNTRLRLAEGAALFICVAIIAYFNLNKYFVTYAWGLPEHNQPWGLQIARYVDSMPSDVTVKLAACCWGKWGQPEPAGMFYVLQHPKGRETIISGKYVRGCADLPPGSQYLVIFAPTGQNDLVSAILTCYPKAQGAMHFDALNQPVFYTLLIP